MRRQNQKAKRNFQSLDEALAHSVARDTEIHATKTPEGAPPAGVQPKGEEVALNAKWVEIEKLDDNPFQPRGTLNADDLVAGFDALGQMQPALARRHPTNPNRYQLVAGHRRKEAVRLGANAGIKQPQPQNYIGKLFIIVREDVSDFEMRYMALEENESRKDLNPIDRAQSYANLRADLESGKATLNGEIVTWADVEKRTNLTYRRIRQLTELLELPPAAQKKIAAEEWNERHGRALLTLKKQPAQQKTLLKQIGEQKLKGAAAERLANKMKKAAASTDTSANVSRGTSAPVSEGVGMDHGAGSADKNDVAESLLKPATNLLTEAARLLPQISMTRDYRVRVENELAQAERQMTKIRTQLQEKD